MRWAVRATFSGATSVVGHRIAKLPRALRAVTAQRAVPTWTLHFALEILWSSASILLEILAIPG